MTIKLRIILLVIVPVLLCSGVSGGFSAWMSYNSAQETMERQSDIVNEAYATALTESINRYTAQVEAMAREAGFFDAAATDQTKVALLQRHAQSSDVSNIGIFGEDGKNLFIGYADGTTVPVGAADVSGRSYLGEALSGKTVVFGPSKDVVTGRLTVTIVAPARAPGAPKSVVAIDFDLDFVAEMVGKAVFGDTGVSFLIDKEGMFIANPYDNMVGQTYKEAAQDDPALFEGQTKALDAALADTGAGHIEYRFDEDFFAAYRRVEGTDGWLLVSSAKVSEYFASYYESIKMQLIALGVFLVIAIVFALYIGQRMSVPIRFASKRADALAQGDLTQIADVKGSRRSDEIGALNRSLDNAIRALNGYIADIADKLGQLSSGDLDVTVTQDYRGDFAPIKASLETITQSFNRMMLDIRQSAAQVASGSEQIAQAATNLAEGSSQQAGTIQEFSATITDIHAKAERNTQTASDALAENQQAGKLMGECTEAMQQMVTAMQAINDSSQNISRVIKVIDDIAFQTNILALNAAVEAARAGQHGKGFSVVAEEVRNLAGKSAQAAKETTALIEQSTRNVEIGGGIVARVDESLRAMSVIAGKNADQISEMDAGSRQQSEALAQINDGILSLSSVVQANSATAQQTAASSEEMSAQSAMLNDVVSRFKLGNEAAALNRPKSAPGLPQGHDAPGYDMGKY